MSTVKKLLTLGQTYMDDETADDDKLYVLPTI